MFAELKAAESSRFIGTTKPIRVLHIVENLNSQAVESWLLRVAQAAAIEYANVHWTFFCVVGKEGNLDALARNIGADVIHSRYEVGDKVRFMRSLREVIKTGRYDILHCHHDIMSAAYLAASVGLPFRKRIVHVHNTALNLPTSSRVRTEIVREPMRQICLRMADQIVGISKEALESIVGNSLEAERYSVVHYAVDTARFSQAKMDREGFRKRLGVDREAKILLFVGRVVEYKNPYFVIDILEQLKTIRPDVVAVFAGAGNQEEEIRKIARMKKLQGRVRLLGFRKDVPDLMVNSDVLIWPSLEDPKEGLGLGIVEAQAAGLPVLMSRSVPHEAIVVPELVYVLPLADGAKAWADCVALILSGPRLARQESHARVECSSFSMAAGVKSLMALYRTID